MTESTTWGAAAAVPRNEAGAVTRELLALAAVLDEEAALAESLVSALTRMRAAVAGGEAAPLEGEVDALGTILHTLQEARRRRARVLAALTGEESVPLDGVAASLELPEPPALTAARRRLRRAGREVLREASINRVVLRRVMDQGDRYLQALFAAPDAPTYGPAERAPGRGIAAGALINRRA